VHTSHILQEIQPLTSLQLAHLMLCSKTEFQFFLRFDSHHQTILYKLNGFKVK